ncbi:MAG: CNNM domain-containing protein [Candidatus Krumholzibacteriota bacterium]
MNLNFVGMTVMGPFWVIGLGAFSLVMTAFFSGCETGYMSVSRVRLRKRPASDSASVKRLQSQLRRIEDPILTCLIGTNLFNVFFTALVTAEFSTRFGAQGEWLALGVVSVLVILFGEILPKVVYREYPEMMTLASAPAISGAMGLLLPVRWLLRGYTSLWNRLLPDHDSGSGYLNRRSLAALLLTNTVPNENDQRFAETLDRFLELEGHLLSNSMRPLDSLVTVGPEVTVAECLAAAAGSGFSRLPVTREDGRDLQGYVLVRDLMFLPLADHENVLPRKFIRPFLLVDERMSPYELFEELRSQGRQLAVVVDGIGNPLGMITLEDLIETVIGSIQDEFDPPAGPDDPAAPQS